MASRKEQKEALRLEREERERQAKDANRRKRLVGYGVAGAIALVAVVMIVALVAVGGGGGDSGSAGGGGDASNMYPDGGSIPDQKVTDLKTAAANANCTLKSVDASGASDHTSSLDQRVKYSTNPPTSGRHYVEVPEDGAYSKPLQDEQFVHNQEHGRIVIWFKPGLPADDRADLKALFDSDSYQMVLTPRKNMPYQVAATAWNGPDYGNKGRLLLCDKYSPAIYDALRTFRDQNRSKGPEPVP
jgi:hypothetical protein